MGIHATAIVEPGATLGRDVDIGPYAVVGAEVTLGDETRLLAHAMVVGKTVVGRSNVIHSFAVVGGEPQVKRGRVSAASALLMGDRNVVREHATLHRGTEGVTRVGSDNLFMVGALVTLANGVQLAGHAVVEDHATFGGLSGVAQFVRVGESAFVAAGAMCERDVPPFVIVQGDRARVRALNLVGLRRREVPEASLESLTRAFRVLFASGVPLARAMREVPPGDAYVDRLLAALGERDAPRPRP